MDNVRSIEAIVNANNDAATYADCAAGSGADTIVLPANADVMLSMLVVCYSTLRTVRLVPVRPAFDYQPDHYRR